MASSGEALFEDVGSGQALIAALTRFALELHKEQVKEKSDGNTFMSPLSISAILNMALLGSRGETLAEMKSSMFLDHLEKDSNLHQAFSDLISHFKRCNVETSIYQKVPAFQLHMANRMYAEKSYKILDEFQASCKKYYDAGLDAVSFWDEPNKAAHEINSWVSKQTNEKIKNVISPHFIDSETTLILVNAIYFKSAWQKCFKEQDTKDAGFYVSSKETLRVQMMYKRLLPDLYYRSSDLLCQVLRFSYVREALSMFILLPDKASSLDALEESLTADHLLNIDQDFTHRNIILNFWLPKFKIEETLDLGDILHKMGMKSLFEKGSADLSGIDGSRLLFASKVVHKSFVDVNEEGTEAAAATTFRLLGGCDSSNFEVVDFCVDHPFLFFIREERTKAVLFLGRVVRPKYE